MLLCRWWLKMAATPESKVKKKVVDVLKQHGAYFFYPVTGGYGRSGVPDIVCCWKDRFIGIECKTQGNVPTQLQMKNLWEIVEQGGVSLVIDETGIGMFALMMESWSATGVPRALIRELTDTRVDWDAAKPTK